MGIALISQFSRAGKALALWLLVSLALTAPSVKSAPLMYLVDI